MVQGTLIGMVLHPSELVSAVDSMHVPVRDIPSRQERLVEVHVAGLVKVRRNIHLDLPVSPGVQLRLRGQLEGGERRMLVGCIQIPQDKQGVLCCLDVPGILSINICHRRVRFRGPAP